MRRLLPDTITSHVLHDNRFDFDPTSPCNVKANYRRLGIRLDDAMAVAISIGMRAEKMSPHCISHADSRERCVQEDRPDRLTSGERNGGGSQQLHGAVEPAAPAAV